MVDGAPTPAARAGGSLPPWIFLAVAMLPLAAAPLPAQEIFSDGFESGSLCAWNAPSVTVDAASLVASTATGGDPLAACLVVDSGARLLVWTELRDSTGVSIPDAEVTIEGVAATESAALPGTYYREVAATGALGTRPLPVVATACGETVALAAAVTVDQVAANATDGGTGGCAPAHRNLRVRVLAEDTGLPLAGAHVLVGAAGGDLLEHGPDARFGGASAPAPSFATTDAAGFAAFYDYGDALASPVPVTAGADARAYFTVVGSAASDFVLALPPLHPPPPTTFSWTDNHAAGTLTGCDDLDSAVVQPARRLESFAAFEFESMLEAERCWDTQNGLVGIVAVPTNVYMPSQAIGFLCLGGTLSEGTWSHDLPASPPTVDLGMQMWSIPVADFQASGSIARALASATYRRIGFLLDQTVGGPQSGATVTLNETYPNAFTVTATGEPPETDRIGLAIGDYDGTDGVGDLFLIASAVHPWDVAGDALAIANSDLDAPGMPAGVRRLGVVVARFLDPDDPGRTDPPGPDRRAASTAILIRGGVEPPFGGQGGTAAVADFLALPAATFEAPSTFRWADAAANGNSPLLSIHDLALRTDRHLPVLAACQTTNEVRPRASAQWRIVAPYGPACAPDECFALPSLPPSFPRAVPGAGQRSGFEAIVGSGEPCTTTCALPGESCVDPDGGGPAAAQCMGGAGTPADPWFTQAYDWRLRVLGLGLLPGSFDFDRFRFGDTRVYLTHEAANRIDW